MASNQTTLSYGAYASGDRHVPSARWANGGGVSTHPLQRQGMVGDGSTMMLGRETAQAQAGIGDGPPAAAFNMPTPPVVTPFQGSQRDARFTI